jgi:uncharacterized membrane protein
MIVLRKTETIIILVVWGFFIISGFANLSGKHQEAEQIIAPLLLMFTSFILFLLGLQRAASIGWYLIWAVSVWLIGFGIEVLGTATTFPFGMYYYGSGLGPKIFDVPIVMGCAWLKIILLGASILYFRTQLAWLGAGIASLFIVCYDLILEPAAEVLEYWYWMTPYPPIQNYIAWFSVSFILLLPVFYGRLFTAPFPRWCVHLFFAEQLYFLIVLSPYMFN